MNISKKKNRILVTGNLGYIGSVLTDILYEKKYDVVGLDIGYYKNCLVSKTKYDVSQIIGDIRDIKKSDLKNFDSIIHLASLSNDPLGEFNPKLTEDINYKSTIKLAKIAKEVGVSRFVFASTQSLYGISNVNEELDEVSGKKNPLTSYAITKWKSEIELNKLIDDNFCVVSYRPSTVFGSSPRFRSDIVFNNFVACAYTTGFIEIKSDGTPWRPVIHVRDVCDAFISGLVAPIKTINGNAYNVGIKNGNFTVKDLAIAAQKTVPNCELIFTGEHGKAAKERTYRVSFERIFKELGTHYSPNWNLKNGGDEIVSFFKEVSFNKKLFRGEITNRLVALKNLQKNKTFDKNLKIINEDI